MNYTYKLGVIGAGNMASAIVNGIKNANLLPRNQIIVSDLNTNTLSTYKTVTTTNNKDVLDNAEIVILAIKPQIFNSIKDSFSQCKSRIILSIMAGVSSASIAKAFPNSQIVRVMPNTPCQVLNGMSVIQESDLDAHDKSFIFEIFNSIGKTLELSEDKFDAVTSVSGSGPAYVYMFIKGMIDAGVKNGLSYADSKVLTLQTFLGGVKMIEKTDKEIDTLIEMVCSKGGTTIEAVEHFKENNLYEIIEVAMAKCKEKSEILGKGNQ